MEEISIEKKRINKNSSSKNALELLDKNDLIDKILQLEAHINQLKNIIKKSETGDQQKTKRKKSDRPFDFANCQKRHILLKFYYLGWNYHGFVEQEDTINTVEHYIFEALKRSCLIENRETSNYHRCGRTDKGVSAFSQVISLNVRSKLIAENQENINEELSYCKILNKILPRDIKCTAWAPVNDDYSARFDCKRRMYKYFFPRGNLSIDNMNTAAQYLIGHHDFRNICKMDVANGVTTFERTIDDAKVICLEENSQEQSGYDMCQLIIQSRAFLWHQIRCIMSILLLVGKRKEKPEIFLDLFDIDKCPSRPQYNLAHELPLNLYHCEYDDAKWIHDEEDTIMVIKTLQEDWTFNAIKAEMMKNMIDDLENNLSSDDLNNYQANCLIQGVQSKVYQPLMKRLTCASLENRIKHLTKKRKIDIKTQSD
ncbi:hypothetical protein PV325_001933 [Microctonus aethiopoides]|nr:hypothetical protein PV325_001933 [Microctonus aethiopoides]